MSPRSWSLGLVRTALALMLLFNLMALAVLVRVTPIGFTVFMFLAQPLFLAALVLFAVAVVGELRARSAPAAPAKSAVSR
jgi:hypothetical protein